MKIKTVQLLDLYSILLELLKSEDLPIKECIARNIIIIQPLVNEYLKKRDLLFLKYVKIGELKLPVVQPKYAEIPNNKLTFDHFEIEKKEEFDLELKKIDNVETEVEFYLEDLSKEILYKDNRIKISEALEMPNNSFSPNHFLLFLQYFFKKPDGNN